MIKSGEYNVQMTARLNDSNDKILISVKNISLPNFTVYMIDSINELVELKTIYKVLDANKYNLIHSTDTDNNYLTELNERLKNEIINIDNKYVDVLGSSIWIGYPRVDNNKLNNPCYFINNEHTSSIINGYSFSLNIKKNRNFQEFHSPYDYNDALKNIAYRITADAPFDAYIIIPNGSKYSNYVPSNYTKVYDKYDKTNKYSFNLVSDTMYIYHKHYSDASKFIDIPIDSSIQADQRNIGVVIHFNNVEMNFKKIKIQNDEEDKQCNILVVQYDKNDELCHIDIHDNLTCNFNNDYEFKISVLDKTKYIKIITIDSLTNMKPILQIQTIIVE